MPTPATIAITPGLGQLLDAVSVVVGGNTVVRETMVVADPTNPANYAGVTAAGALQVDGSAVTQPVSIASTAPVAEIGTGSIASSQVSVGASATQIVAARSNRRAVKITNLGTTDVFIGPSGVSTATGDLLVGTRGSWTILDTQAAVFGIVASGSQSVSVLEEF